MTASDITHHLLMTASVPSILVTLLFAKHLEFPEKISFRCGFKGSGKSKSIKQYSGYLLLWQYCVEVVTRKEIYWCFLHDTFRIFKIRISKVYTWIFVSNDKSKSSNYTGTFTGEPTTGVIALLLSLLHLSHEISNSDIAPFLHCQPKFHV